jgi:hypothetical protein
MKYKIIDTPLPKLSPMQKRKIENLQIINDCISLLNVPEQEQLIKYLKSKFKIEINNYQQ